MCKEAEDKERNVDMESVAESPSIDGSSWSDSNTLTATTMQMETLLDSIFEQVNERITGACLSYEVTIDAS